MTKEEKLYYASLIRLGEPVIYFYSTQTEDFCIGIKNIALLYVYYPTNTYCIYDRPKSINDNRRSDIAMVYKNILLHLLEEK